MRKLMWIVPLIVMTAAVLQVRVAAQQAGLPGQPNLRKVSRSIAGKKPVFGGACRLCPWGAMAEVVQAAMKPYG